MPAHAAATQGATQGAPAATASPAPVGTGPSAAPLCWRAAPAGHGGHQAHPAEPQGPFSRAPPPSWPTLPLGPLPLACRCEHVSSAAVLPWQAFPAPMAGVPCSHGRCWTSQTTSWIAYPTVCTTPPGSRSLLHACMDARPLLHGCMDARPLLHGCMDARSLLHACMHAWMQGLVVAS